MKGDRYAQSAENYISWNPKTPVKIRMGRKAPENLPPILSQTMLRNTVNKYPNRVAVAFKQGNAIIEWTYKVSLKIY